MPAITWTTTTQGAPWVAQPSPEARPMAIEAMTDFPNVILNRENRHQTITGFGVCFNELGWRALERLTPDERTAILRDLFSGDDDASGFTICRMPVGANDFSTDWYSYDETPGDLALDDFTIEHDRETLVPFIRAAQEHRPELALWASPWSPPTWMKTNGHYAAALPFPGSGVENGITESQVGREGTDMFRVEPGYLDAYARYFRKFVEAYAAEGIRIGMVMPQNEFNSPQVFPSCTWTPDGLARFIAVLGPVMDEIGVEVFFGTQERADPALLTDVLAAPDAARWIRGAGFQWAGKGAVSAIHREHPELAIYQTEQECGDGLNDWRFARHTWNLMKHFLSNGASAYTYWNLALDEGGVSRWGWAQNSLVVVDPSTNEFRYTHEHWLMKHLSSAVKPGAVRIDAFTWSGYENQLAFENPDGSVVVVVQNDLAEEMPYRFGLDGQVVEAVLPADSFSTFTVG